MMLAVSSTHPKKNTTHPTRPPKNKTKAGYDGCAPRLVRLLERLAASYQVPPDYTYYGLASPWLQVGWCCFVGGGRPTTVS